MKGKERNRAWSCFQSPTQGNSVKSHSEAVSCGVLQGEGGEPLHLNSKKRQSGPAQHLPNTFFSVKHFLGGRMYSQGKECSLERSTQGRSGL